MYLVEKANGTKFNLKGSLKKDKFNSTLLKNLLEEAKAQEEVQAIFEKGHIFSDQDKNKYISWYFRRRLDYHKRVYKKKQLRVEEQKVLDEEKNMKNRQNTVSRLL